MGIELYLRHTDPDLQELLKLNSVCMIPVFENGDSDLHPDISES
jgi:hypothetical protein